MTNNMDQEKKVKKDNLHITQSSKRGLQAQKGNRTGCYY
jgi:hypothetical protein